MPDLGLNSFTKKYIKNILARVTGYIEESTGVASNYCNYMNTQTKNPFEIEHIITDHYEWFTDEYAEYAGRDLSNSDIWQSDSFNKRAIRKKCR